MSSIIQSIQFKRGNRRSLEAVLRGDKRPLSGEPIWEIDSGKLKIGDGKRDYVDLPYISGSADGESDLVLNGYYSFNIFYKESECLNPLPRYVTKLYLDLFGSGVYYYATDGAFHALVSESQVDSGIPGLIKLYGTTGYNDDGTMTQKAITENLDKKVEMSLSDIHEECIIFNSNRTS